MPCEALPLAEKDLLWYITPRLAKEHLLWKVIWRNANTIMDACEPIGYRYRFSRVYHPSGAFVFENPSIENDQDHMWRKPLWCNLHPLELCVFLSRLVYPTPANLRWAARCIVNHDMLVTVIPARYDGWFTEAYLAMPQKKISGRRTWYTPQEISVLRQILTSFRNRRLPERLRRSFWSYTYGFSCPNLTARWHFIAQSIQSLTVVSEHCSRQQFKQRLLELAKEARAEISMKEIERIWRYRNIVDHGNSVTEATDEDIALLEKTEMILTEVLRQALLDESFAARWQDEETLRRCYPVVI